MNMIDVDKIPEVNDWPIIHHNDVVLAIETKQSKYLQDNHELSAFCCHKLSFFSLLNLCFDDGSLHILFTGSEEGTTVVWMCSNSTYRLPRTLPQSQQILLGLFIVQSYLLKQKIFHDQYQQKDQHEQKFVYPKEFAS